MLREVEGRTDSRRGFDERESGGRVQGVVCPEEIVTKTETPLPYEELRRLAEENPPSPEWYEEDIGLFA